MDSNERIKNPSPVEDLTYEEAFEELEQITSILESGEQSLDQVLTLFERGQSLLKRCSELLDEAELKVQKILGDELSEFISDE